MMRCQHNARIHVIATAMVIAAGFFSISHPGMVLDCTRGLDHLDGGGFKHGVRILADAASPNFHPVMRDAKHVAAGAC